MFTIIISQLLKMMILMLIGVFCYRGKIVDHAGSKVLANLLLMLINPLVTIMALQTDYSSHLVKGLLLSFLLAAAIHGGGILIARIFIRSSADENYTIERFSAVYSNCGFIGIPLIQSLFGNEGVLYLTAYMTTFNFFAFTHGIALMTGKTSLKDLKKGLLSPMIIACIVGVILFFLRIRLPDLLADSFTYISCMNTGLAMIIAGISVSQTDFRAMLKKPKLYLVAFLKLLVIPALVLLILIPLNLNTTVACTLLIASACPAAATCTAFTLQFQKDHRYASELYTFTTVASLVTIPLFVLAAEHLL